MALTSIVNRRVALTGGLGALAGTVVFRSSLLAEGGGTTPEGADPDERGARLLDRARDALAIVEADRASLPAGADTAAIDDLIDRAEALLEGATGGEGTIRAALAAISVLSGAQALILGQANGSSLPSQEGGSSHALAAAYEFVSETGAELPDTGDPGIAELLALAQDLYATGYSQFNAGDYAPAARSGQAAAHLAIGARILSGESGWDAGDGPSHRRVRRNHRRRSAAHRALRVGVTDNLLRPVEPVAVPAPDFAQG
jgi:hypothetical protein